MFESMPLAPKDPVLSLSEIFKNDVLNNKINLGIGVYTKKTNSAPILISVKRAEKLLLEKEIDKNYLNIEGAESFSAATQSLLFGQPNLIVDKNRIRTIQSIGGTGALRIAAECISKNSKNPPNIWISQPTWINHNNIFIAAGLQVHTYPYYNNITRTIDFDRLLSTLNNNVKPGDIVLFHGCCHNPTGIDPSNDQWKILSEYSEKNHWIPLFDLAYQGFDCDLQSDLRGIHIFCKNNPELIICNSYSKNFGLYNERIGACTVIAKNQNHAERVLSQLRSVIRASYSNPPYHGSAIVTTILLNKDLRVVWENELKNMRQHIQDMRMLFFQNLKKIMNSSKIDFSFIKNQCGMFSFIGLNTDQVLKLRKKYGLYLVGSGRINLSGLSNKNIEYVCSSLKKIYNE